MKKRTKIIILVAVVLALLTAAFLLVWYLYVVPMRDDQERMRLGEESRAAKRARYAEENAALSPGEADVVFLGDSLTDGCPIETYYPNYKTLNRGIGGDRTYDLLSRMQVSVYDVKPKVAVVLIGGNNLTTMFDDYEEILKGLQGTIPDTKVILVSLTAMRGDHQGKNAIAALNNVKIKALADKYGYRFVDIFSTLYDIEEGALYKKYAFDDVHLNADGYAAVTPLINAAIAEALAEWENKA